VSDDLDREEVWKDFNARVNMAPKELEEWLETEESKSVGDSDTGESTGHKSGRKIVKIKHTKKAELTDEQWQWMNKVVGYINRHCAQVPGGSREKIAQSRWAYSLKNWGHDPMKDDGCA
jgi:hypothetical protein